MGAPGAIFAASRGQIRGLQLWQRFWSPAASPTVSRQHQALELAVLLSVPGQLQTNRQQKRRAASLLPRARDNSPSQWENQRPGLGFCAVSDDSWRSSIRPAISAVDIDCISMVISTPIGDQRLYSFSRGLHQPESIWQQKKLQWVTWSPVYNRYKSPIQNTSKTTSTQYNTLTSWGFSVL